MLQTFWADTVTCLIQESHTLCFPLCFSEIQGCGIYSTQETGIIKSQNWPMNYKANTECIWNIQQSFGKKIILNFTHFDLEGKDIFTSRCYDNIEIFDINSLTNKLMQKHGKLVPKPLVLKLIVYFMMANQIVRCSHKFTF